jgi:hypothetical protein
VSTQPAQGPSERLQAVTSPPIALEPVIWQLNGDSGRGRGGGLAPRISWSRRAKKDLKAIVAIAAVRDQLRRNAGEILHDISSERRPRCADVGDGGAAGEIMWHRGVAHEHELLPEQADGPESYFLFYRRQTPPPGFEVLAVRSTQQVAILWERMSRESANEEDPPLEVACLVICGGDHAQLVAPGSKLYEELASKAPPSLRARRFRGPRPARPGS